MNTLILFSINTSDLIISWQKIYSFFHLRMKNKRAPVLYKDFWIDPLVFSKDTKKQLSLNSRN